MTLKLYNTLTRTKEAFKPADETRVTMYCCGPTVYSYAHIGNARAAVAADVLFRVLRHIYGEDHVVYARNITDVDDKINASAREQGVDISVITNKFADIYNEDLKALNCLMPTMQPRATAHMDEMIAMISKLIKEGHAYEADGHVLFDVSSYENYGQLCGRSTDDNLAGARVQVACYKRSPEDFVLWKPSEKGDPVWDAPFGAGRPGWHLECSAMIEKNLGTTIDIHCGGQDLKFPHHENEIAQSTCAHGGAPLANYWVHNGFLQMDSEKMSKSLGNVKLVHELLKTWDGEVLRFALLSGQYRNELDWTDALLKQAKSTLGGWYRTLEKYGVEGDTPKMPDEVWLHLVDDLNTVGCMPAFAAMQKYIREKSELIEGMLTVQSDFDISRVRAELNHMVLMFKASANLLGLLEKDPEEWLKGKAQEGGLTDAEIDVLIKDRAEARATKNWTRSDEIRDTFAQENIILEDGVDGTTWRRG